MPALETRAINLTLLWRTRSVARLSKKFLHLSDSQSALGCMSKHRSGAASLTYLVERAAALQLAGNVEPIFGFVRTHINPADRPSRTKIPVRKVEKTSSAWKCAVPGCRRVANYQCHNCSQRVCRNHCYSHGKRETFCLACRGYQLHSKGAPTFLRQKAQVGKGALAA